MKNTIVQFPVSGWLFGTVVLCIGLLNLFLVHAVPGLVFLLLSLVYFPPVNMLLHSKFRISIPIVIKLILAVLIVWFTLGVSDLGDMID